MSTSSLKNFVCLLLLAAAAFAQSEGGGASLNGTVTDQSDAAVPSARVTITSPATGLSRTTNTNDAGLYSFPRLPVGTYDLTVDAQGFKAARRTSIPLQVGAVATI